MDRSLRKYACILMLCFWVSPSHAAKTPEEPTAPVAVQSPSSPSMEAGPSLQVTEMSHNFGEVMEGAEVTHDFKIGNTGTAPLEINQVRPG